jgi:hypothetical protein
MNLSPTRTYNLPSQLWWAGFISLIAVLIVYAFALPARYFDLVSSSGLNATVALVQIGSETFIIIVSAIFGIFLIFRRPLDRIAMLTALVMVLATPNITGLSLRAKDIFPLLEIPGLLMVMVVPILSYWFLLALPDGHIEIRWMRWGLIPLTIWELFRNFYPFWLTPAQEAPFRLNSLMISVPLVLVAFIGMVYRFRKLATPKQKQEFKWYFVGICVAAVGLVTSIVFRLIAQRFGNPEISLWVGVLSSFLVAAVGLFSRVTLILAVTKRGLWEVDLTINRGLVTLIVSLILALIFGTLFFLTQAGLRLLLGANRGEIAVAVSALLVGLGFNPLRERVRHFVDRRIFGFRFDLNQLARAQSHMELAAQTSLIGQTIGGYEITGVLGRGGMGEVYKAVSNGKVAAVKILSDAENQERFEREAAIRLEHPNIVKTYEYGEANGLFYLALEYIEGKTLKTLLQERGKFSFAEIEAFLPTIAKAIDFAHNEGYVHRDIKPSNIMLRQKSSGGTEAVLMDFGLVKFAGETSSLTGSGAIGTIDYMAPEQIMDSGRVDYRADIYALGVVLYEVLAGTMPFHGTVGQVLFAHLQQPPPDIRDSMAEIPETVAIAIQRALSKDPADRFQSANAFVQSLRSAA